MSQVSFYKEETRCQCCGRYIKNVVEIDSVQYGIVCADAFLPKSMLAVAKKDFNLAIKLQDEQARRDLHASLLDYALEQLNGTFLINRTTDFYLDYVKTRPNSPFVLAIFAILASRSL